MVSTSLMVDTIPVPSRRNILCAVNCALTPELTHTHREATHSRRCRFRACRRPACALKPQCCPGQPARKIPRSIHEGARDLARDLALTDAYATSRRQRKKIEMLFAHLKRILKLDRLRLRGPNGAKDEFLLAATAQNLRKLAKLIPTSTQPMPA